MAYKTVVFDLDGTLLDTLEDLYLSVNRALVANGLARRSRDEVRLATGNGIARLIRICAGEACDQALYEKVFSDFKADYAEHSMDHTAPYAGMVEVVAALRAAGCAVAVVSNKADFAVQTIIEQTFPGAFDCVMGENEAAGIRKKPAPDMVLAALGRMGVAGAVGGPAAAGDPATDPDPAADPAAAGDPATAATQIAYVGDSEVDLATAANLGCDCVTCTWGFRDRAWLVEQGAKVLVDTTDELLAVLLG